MKEVSKTLILWSISFVVTICLFSFSTQAQDGSSSETSASSETNTYVFLPEESAIVQTGGIAGVHRTYTVEGLLQLSFDPNAGTALFIHVDAKATDDSQLRRTLDPKDVFNMTTLAGTFIDDTTISFTGKADDGSDVLITVTIEDDLIYLVGQTTPPPNSADFFLFSINAIAKRKYSGGTGEPNEPYQIATAEDLILLSESLEDYDKHFILTADIDLNPNLPGRKVFDRAVIAPDINDTESGFQGIPFTGIFDGSGHTISNLKIIGVSNLGLFGRLESGAQIKDLGVVDVNVNGSDAGIGGLAGTNTALTEGNGGSITTSYSTGMVTGNQFVGGLVGFNWGSITTSYSTITVTGDSYTGGLVGYNRCSVATSYSEGTVNGYSDVGGLVGYNKNDCSIISSYSTATVTGEWPVGGLVGTNIGYIVTSYSTATVTGEWPVGGLVGTNYGYIVTSYSTGTVSSAWPGTTDRGELKPEGGLVGNGISNRVIGSFWDVETSSSKTSDGGVGLSRAEMQNLDTFLNAGWDFVDEITNGTCDYWKISPGDYPRLRYNFDNSPVMPEGLGTEEQPYLIRDVQDLGTVWFKPLACYRLEASLDLSEITWSMAVISWFGGTFEGNDHIISHLTIVNGGHLGLFGRLLSTSKVSNLGVEDVNIIGSGQHIGGLVGSNRSGWLETGGIINNCYSSGTVSGEIYVGGLVGDSGITGNIQACYSTAMVSGDYIVGGLVGDTDPESNLNLSYSTGFVTGIECVGGLVGCHGNGNISNCYSTSTVSGDNLVGGLVGLSFGTVTTSYSTGKVTGNIDVGGLVGNNFDTEEVIDCFWDIQVSGQATSAGGIGLTTDEMQIGSTFIEAGWDFVDETDNGTEDIWWILEGQDYPRLWWEPLK
jgi:hypothetical protein